MWVNFLGTFPKHISHVSTYFRNQYFFGCFIAQMIWLFNVQLSTCWAYWATASSSAYPQCARKWGYTEPEPSRGLSQQSKTQRWCRHQPLKSYWRRKYHEISHVLIILHRLRQRSVKNVKFSPSCPVPSLSRTFAVASVFYVLSASHRFRIWDSNARNFRCWTALHEGKIGFLAFCLYGLIWDDLLTRKSSRKGWNVLPYLATMDKVS